MLPSIVWLQREEVDEIREFLKKKKLDVTVSLDPMGHASEAYGVEGIPMLVLIDKAGIVQSVHVGFSPNIGKAKLKVKSSTRSQPGRISPRNRNECSSIKRSRNAHRQSRNGLDKARSLFQCLGQF